MKIAIIDDIVSPKHLFNLQKDTKVVNINIETNFVSNSEVDILTHGTICTNLIIKNLHRGHVYCFNAKPFWGNGNIKDILKSFDMCIDLGINVIHMSIGSCAYEDKITFEKYVKLFRDKGILVIAAHCNNKNLMSYPASLNGVIGVKQTIKSINNIPYIFELSNERIQIGMRSDLVYDSRSNTRLIPCNSFAAAIATNYILNRDIPTYLNYDGIFKMLSSRL